MILKDGYKTVSLINMLATIRFENIKKPLVVPEKHVIYEVIT